MKACIMKEASVMMQLADEVDNTFIRTLREHFPHITHIERTSGHFNIVIYLRFRRIEEFKELYNKLHEQFRAYHIKDDMVIVDELPTYPQGR
ncbi:MAG: hypothetical protein ACFFD4_14540 [Candidatus Odinarchaeota archaeon]